MRVLHLSSRDITGGGPRAAWRLHRGLIERGVDSRMLVGVRLSSDEAVATPAPARRLDRRLRQRWLYEAYKREQRMIAHKRPPGAELFSGVRSPFVDCWSEPLDGVGVVNLHVVFGLLDYQSFFASLPRRTAMVWTLHDVNAFTGGCHYAGTCDRFTARCGKCPQLGSSLEDDLSRQVFEVKAKAYDGLDPARVAIVTPSRWMAAEAKRSALFGRFRVEHISNGLDLETFRPRGRGLRQALGLAETDRLVLFVSDVLDSHRKGLDLLLAAIGGLEYKERVVVASVGHGPAPRVNGVRQLDLGHIGSDDMLAAIYSSADVFAMSSREDNLPQAAVEAAACGCPVVGFAIGGVPDIVEHGRTGYLAKPFDIAGLRDCIEAALERREALSPGARNHAESLFGLSRQAKAYADLYAELQGPPAKS